MRSIFLSFYFLCVFLLLLFINLYYLEGIPHVPDSQAYLFMAKMFSHGVITAPIPFSPTHFDFFPGILSVEKGTWLFQYPFGHPLLLMLGVLVGFPNLIPPLIGTAFVFLLYKIGLELFDKKTALFALLLPILSPFFLENASSFMSHNTAAFYLLLSFYFLILSFRKDNFLLPLLAGIFIGLLFNTRPLTSLPFLVSFGLLAIFKSPKSKKIDFSVLFFFGFFFLFLCFLFYNKIVSGNFFTLHYYMVNQNLFISSESTSLEFIANRFQNATILFKNFSQIIFAWPAIFTYMFLFIPLATKRRSFWDVFCFIMLFTLPVAYFFYNGTFLMYGPRFWYEITPFAFLLTAHSFSLFISYKKRTTLVFFALFSIFSLFTVFGILPSKDPDFFSPINLNRLKGFNFTDRRIKDLVEKREISNAIVFVKNCNGNWWCYGSVFSENSYDLDSEIIYAKDLGEQNKRLLKHFPKRSAFLIDYDTLELTKIQ